MPRDPYTLARLAARRREFAIETANAAAIQRALDRFVARLVREISSLTGPRRAIAEASLDVVRNMADEMGAAILQATREGRSVAYDDIIDIWDAATRRAVEAQGIDVATLGAISRPAVSVAGVFDAVGSPQSWQTLLRGHVEDAAGEAGTVVREAILAGESPESVARKLRRYVQGSEALDDLFDGDRIDLRQAIPRELQGAARQMQTNAQRIAFTELHNARFEAETEHFARDPMVRAQRRVLSPDRGTLTAPDECDVLATADFYGLGPGVYPVTAMPPEPHPYGRCENVPVVSDTPVAEPPQPPLQSPTGYSIPREQELTDAARDRIQEQVGRSLAFAEEVRRTIRRGT